MIRDFFYLNRLGTYQFKNKFKINMAEGPVTTLFLILLGTGFMGGYLFLSFKLLRFCYNQDVYGVQLANFLVQILLFLAIGVALVSSLTTAITHFYLSKDLEFQFSLPVNFNSWVLHRFFQVFIQSSGVLLLFAGPFIWMFLYFSGNSLPEQLLGVVIFGIGCSFPIIMASLLCMILVKIFPPRRIHQVFLVLTVILVSCLILIFRYLEPERFIGSGGIALMLESGGLLKLGQYWWNPANWCYQVIKPLSEKNYGIMLPQLARLMVYFTVAILALLATARRFYRASWDRALQSLTGEMDSRDENHRVSRLSGLLSHPQWSQEIRELLLFVRDPSQWSQTFVLMALLGLYLFSISKINDGTLAYHQAFLERTNAKYILALLNSSMIAFITLSIASRFVFTSFSADGQAIWLMKTAPDGWLRFMRSKLLVFGVPCLIFAELLCILSGVVLTLNASQIWVLATNCLWDSLIMILAALGMGMLFISPNIENPLKLIISPGGILLMAAGLFVTFLHLVFRLSVEIRPLNELMMRIGWPNLQDGRDLWFAAGLIVVEAILLTLLIRRGVRHLRTGNFSMG